MWRKTIVILFSRWPYENIKCKNVGQTFLCVTKVLFGHFSTIFEHETGWNNLFARFFKKNFPNDVMFVEIYIVFNSFRKYITQLSKSHLVVILSSSHHKYRTSTCKLMLFIIHNMVSFCEGYWCHLTVILFTFPNPFLCTYNVTTSTENRIQLPSFSSGSEIKTIFSLAHSIKTV